MTTSVSMPKINANGINTSTSNPSTSNTNTTHASTAHASTSNQHKIKQHKINENSINENIERIQDQAIDLNNLLAMQAFPACGGLALFAGTVRNHHDGKEVKSLKYTAYKPLAEKMIRQIEREIEHKHQVSYVRVVHRIGHLNIGEVAIYAVARSDHRREAFAACEEAVERVKHEVPVWKEEFYTDGSSVFVEGCCIRTDFGAAAPKQPLTLTSEMHPDHAPVQSDHHLAPHNHTHCSHK